MKTITQAQYYQLIGLRAVGDRQHAMLDAVVTAAADITGEEKDAGQTMDYIWGSQELDELLKRLEITVERADPTVDAGHEG